MANMTHTQGSSDGKDEEKTQHGLRREPTREEKTKEAIDEGHDADIPSSLGFVLDEAGERKRRASLARKQVESSTNAPDVEKEAPGLAPSNDDDSDGDVVWWDNDHDPQNPYNWARWRKGLNCVLISALTFVTPLASCERSLRCSLCSNPLLSFY